MVMCSDSYNSAIARLVGALAIHSPSSVEPLILAHLVGERPSTQLSSMAIREIIDQAPNAFYDLDLAQVVLTKVFANASSTSPPSIARPAREAKEFMKEREPWMSDEAVIAKL